VRHSDDTEARDERRKEESKDALLKIGPDVAGEDLKPVLGSRLPN
jgi:hypothetical protein